MKKAFRYIMFLTASLCVSQVTLYAQDGHDYTHSNGYDDKQDDNTADSFNDPEGKTLNTHTKSTVAKDTSAIRTPQVQPRIRTNQETTEGKPQLPASHPAAGDDSILSFNFLYYMIQKFKLQDIIE